MLYKTIKQTKPNVFLLDGDIGRKAYNDQIGYTQKDREIGAYRNSRVCKMIVEQGIDVICCTVSMFNGVRNWNRENFNRYREIFLDVPMGVLIKRDKKQLYSRIENGSIKNVVGLDLSSEYPQSPDLRIVNDGSLSPDEVLKKIMRTFPELNLLIN